MDKTYFNIIVENLEKINEEHLESSPGEVMSYHKQ